MNNLSYNVGYKEYSINGDESRILRIKMTDYAIFDRFTKAMKQIDKIAKEYENSTANTFDEANNLFVSVDKKIRKQIDFIFDGDVSDIIFGNTNCISIAGGKPVFQNFLEAILPSIKKDIGVEQQEIAEKVHKYTSKVK